MSSVLQAMTAWLGAPYDPELAAELALSLPEEQAEIILQRQSAYDPNLHLVVFEVYPQAESRHAVFCTRGHRFVGKTPLEAMQASEGHV